jgi:hypothetical protein
MNTLILLSPDVPFFPHVISIAETAPGKAASSVAEKGVKSRPVCGSRLMRSGACRVNRRRLSIRILTKAAWVGRGYICYGVRIVEYVCECLPSSARVSGRLLATSTSPGEIGPVLASLDRYISRPFLVHESPSRGSPHTLSMRQTLGRQ